MLLKSRALNSINKYKYGFNKFCKWCKLFNIDPLPASDFDVALYIVSLLQSAASYSVIDDAFYSINWVHDISDNTNPCKTSLVKNVKEGALRSVGHTVTKKEPITPEIIKKMIDLLDSENTNLYNLRSMCMFLLGYSGFLRFSELINITRADLTFHEQYVCIHITKSKTDHYREGSEVLIAKTGFESCPVAMLKRYLDKADIDHTSQELIFRSVVLVKSTGQYKLKGIKSLSYTRAREIVLSVLAQLGLDIKKFGLHSLRSGGATAAANGGVTDRLFKKHGRWRTDKAKDGYVKEDVDDRLSVTKRLGI